MPYEHPLDTIKTVMQSHQKTDMSFTDAVQLIYRNRGIKGFYAGFIPNFTRIVLKTAYRLPMMLELPLMITRFSNQLFDKKISSTASKSIAGVVIAGFEVLIITPMERLKVWLMTKDSSVKNIRYFFRHSHQLFRGLELVFWKQNVSWVTFLGTDEFMKNFIRKERHLANTDMLPFWELFSVSLTVGLINTLFVMPLDFLKTRIQKDGSQDGQKVRELTVLAKSLYKEHGAQLFYSGWKVRMVHYMLQSMLTMKLYDMLETSYRMVNSSS